VAAVVVLFFSEHCRFVGAIWIQITSAVFISSIPDACLLIELCDLTSPAPLFLTLEDEIA
jgi:hypothetical protein